MRKIFRIILKISHFLLLLCGIIFVLTLLSTFIPPDNITKNYISSFINEIAHGKDIEIKVEGDNVISKALGIESLYRSVKTDKMNGFTASSWHQSVIGGSGCLYNEKMLKKPESSWIKISHPKTSTVLVGINSKGVGDNGIQLIDDDTPDLSLADYNSDGSMDLLEYSVLDSNNDIEMNIIDYGVDGQIDLKIGFQGNPTEIFYEGKWYQVKKDLKIGEKGLSVGEITKILKDQHGILE